VCGAFLGASRFVWFYFIDGWHREGHPYKKQEYGKWELQIPANPDGSCPIAHMSEIKVTMVKDYWIRWLNKDYVVDDLEFYIL
jgi:hypothetical protein